MTPLLLELAHRVAGQDDPLAAPVESLPDPADLDSLSNAITDPALSAASHGVADAIGMERVDLATRGDIGQDSLNAFDAAGKAFVAACAG